jgi:hypothetical protein
MTLRTLVAVVILFGGFQIAAPASAQETPESTPAHLSFVEGDATLEREGQVETATPGMPLGAGDRLRTDSGRAEVLFADGSALHVDEISTVDMSDSALLRLVEGRVFLVVAAYSAERYRIDTPAARIEIYGTGEYRVSILNYLGRPETELAVVRGSASLSSDYGSMPVRAGQRVLAQADRAPGGTMAFNSAAWDEFDQWSEERRAARAGVESNQYLPQEVRGYAGIFDHYGSWSADPTYGYVWYPAVGAGWRPFYNGFWYHGKRWGSTWIGWDPWGWPTHHFGRWGLSPLGAYYWIPARRWSPAWVAWASTPGFFGWCPLGFDGRALVHPGHFSGFRGHGWTDPWRAWTVAPAHRFGFNTPVRQFAVSRGGLPPLTGAFQTLSTPPFETPARYRSADVTRGIPRVPGALTRTPIGRAAASGIRRSVPGTAVARPTPPPTAIDPVTPSPPYARPVQRAGQPVESPYERAGRVMAAPGRREAAPRRAPENTTTPPPPSERTSPRPSERTSPPPSERTSPPPSERTSPPPSASPRQPATRVRTAPEGRSRAPAPVRPQPRGSMDGWYRSPNRRPVVANPGRVGAASPYPNRLASPRVWPAPYRNEFARPARSGPDTRVFRSAPAGQMPFQRPAAPVSPYFAPYGGRMAAPPAAPPRAAPQRSAPSAGARAAQPRAGGARRR